MPSGRITVAIIGAGDTGTPLLTQLIGADFVDIVGVADLDTEAPGMRLATENGVRTTTNFMDLVGTEKQVDLVIDVTGVKQVRYDLLQHLHETSNRHTIIVRELIAILLMSLSSGRVVEMKHGDMEY